MKLKLNEDRNAHFATGLAGIALVAAIFAVSTDNWYLVTTEFKIGSNVMLKNMKSIQSFGLWRICTTSNIMSVRKVCIKVSEISKMKNGDEKKIIYPDYLKAIQGLEIVAILSGALVVVLCVMHSVLYTTYRTRMISVTMMIMIGTGVIQMICIGLWVIEKEKEKHDPKQVLGQMDSALKENPLLDTTMSYGWSWGMAIVSCIMHIASTITLTRSLLRKPHDEMDLRLATHCV